MSSHQRDRVQVHHPSFCRVSKQPTEATPPLLHTALLAVYSKCMLRLQIQHCAHRQTCCEIAKSSLFWAAAAPCRYFCVITLLLLLYYTEISFYLLILPEDPDFSLKWTELSCLKCNQPCVIICREDTAYWSYRRQTASDICLQSDRSQAQSYINSVGLHFPP